jgi:hypothetical protein
MRINYNRIISEISKTYGKGYYRLWTNLSSLKEELGDYHFKIVHSVVDDYLRECNARSSTRFFGAFPEWDIPKLISKCIDLEDKLRAEKINIPVQ